MACSTSARKSPASSATICENIKYSIYSNCFKHSSVFVSRACAIKRYKSINMRNMFYFNKEHKICYFFNATC
jgi:hypothetical protein